MVRFAIDERSVDLNGLAIADAQSVFKEFLDRITAVGFEGHEMCYDEELFFRDVRNGQTFWQLFAYDSDLHLENHDYELAVAAFGTMSRWYDIVSPQPTELDVRIDGGAVETSGTIAWVHAQGHLGLSAAACLSIPCRRTPGRYPVQAGDVSRSVWFLASQSDVEHYFRNLLSECAQKPGEFAAFAGYAFRDLLFVDDCFEGIRKMSRSCRDLAPDIVRHLSAFSDVGRQIFAGPWQSASDQFGSLGVNISDENGTTKRNNEAAKERMRLFNGREMHFWWHSKLERHQDRIHICPDFVPNGGQIIIGIFCLHLK